MRLTCPSDTVYTKINKQWQQDRKPFMGSDMKPDLYHRWWGLSNVTMTYGCGSRRYVGIIADPQFLETFIPMLKGSTCKCPARQVY